MLQTKGATSEAREIFQRLTEQYPQADLAWSALGLLDASLGKDDLARAELERSLEVNPVQALPQLTYGELLVNAGEYEQALEALKIAAPLLPDEPLLATRVHAAMARAYQGLSDTSGPQGTATRSTGSESGS